MPTAMIPKVPQNLSGLLVKSPQPYILCSGNKDQPACGHHRTAQILSTGYRNPLCCQLFILPERHLPDPFAAVQVDRIEGTPWRLGRRVPLLIKKQLIGDIDSVSNGHQLSLLRVALTGGQLSLLIDGKQILDDGGSLIG